MAINNEVDPILIASVKDNRLLFSTTTFRDILSRVGARPVSVVSIAYPNGEEKNQIFNEILKYLKTLDIKNNKSEPHIWRTKSKTDPKGIYLWPDPTIIRKNCEEAAVLLIEMNGNFDPMTATQEDVMLFALNCVLSSTMIYGFENNLWSEIQEFLQLFGRYGKGGIGSELSESFLNLVLLVNNWKTTKRYPFGYHDSSTCPQNSHNYRKEILDSELAQNKVLKEEKAFKNKHFVNSFHKIGFCLMPGTDPVIDQNSNVVKFGDLWQQITSRLFHPSNLSIKNFGQKKFNGQQLVTLFNQICALMSENQTQSLTPEEFTARISL